MWSSSSTNQRQYQVKELHEKRTSILKYLGKNRSLFRLFVNSKSSQKSDKFSEYLSFSQTFVDVSFFFSKPSQTVKELDNGSVKATAKHTVINDMKIELTVMFHDSVWMIDHNSTYIEWLSSLNVHIYKNILLVVDDIKDLQTQDNRSLLIYDELKSFIAPFIELRVLQSSLQVSESLFCILLFSLDLILLKNTAISREIRKKLEYLVLLSEKHVISQIDSKFTKSISKLIVNAVVFMLRQDIEKDEAIDSKTGHSLMEVDEDDEYDDNANTSHSETRRKRNWKLPFSVPFRVSLTKIAIGALSCDQVCSSMLLIELSSEEQRNNSAFVGIHSNSFNISSYLTEKQSQVAFNCSQKIHDLDFIHGYILNSVHHGYRSSSVDDLYKQCGILYNDGRFVELLSNYESILKISQNKRNSMLVNVSPSLITLGDSVSMFPATVSNQDSLPKSLNSKSYDSIVFEDILVSLDSLGYQYINQQVESAQKYNESHLDGVFNKSGSHSFDVMRQWDINEDSIHRVHQNNSTVSNSIKNSLNKLAFCKNLNEFKDNCQGLMKTVLYNISTHLHDEYGIQLIKNLLDMQHLLEIDEVSELLRYLNASKSFSKPSSFQNITTSSSVITSSASLHNEQRIGERILKSWDTRIKSLNLSKNLNALVLSTFDLRLKLLQVLIDNKLIKSSDGISLLDHIIDKMKCNSSLIHSLIPLVYNLKSICLPDAENDSIDLSSSQNITKLGQPVEREYSSSSMSNNATYNKVSDDVSVSDDRMILNIKWSLGESQILWKRGLEDIALSNLKYNVINSMQSCLNLSKNQTSAEKSEHYDILSEALRLG